MLIDLVILAVGLWGLILVLRLRAVLSLYFPEMEAECPKRSVEPPAGSRDLFEQAGAELSALGFDPPRWVLCRSRPALGHPVRLQAVFVHPTQGAQFWLSPPVDVNRPNRLLAYVTSRLEDGRWAVTQIRDPYFESLADPRTPAQTVASESLEKVFKLHRRWRANLGSPVDTSTPVEALIEQFAGEWQMEIRARLANADRIHIEDGIGRPGLRFAWQILRRLRRMPAVRPGSDPVPAARLGLLAGLLEQVSRRQPSAFHERLLFAASGVLFVLLGTPFFGVELALVLLFVIVLHELGHWLAMRGFGYHNPHITLLPLLGGVTMGHENDPDPAKRAWVSLAGPLPGIVLGWALAFALFAEAGGPDGWPEVTSTVIGVLLVINYLNVLPIPPLDGSHVLRALLPARWVVVQIALVVAGVILAVLLGWWFELWILSGIALLQLLTVPGQWRVYQAVKTLAGRMPATEQPKAERMRAALEGLESLYGPATLARPRIDQARQVVTLLSTRPMSAPQRLIISLVFVALLAVPVAGGVVYVGLSSTSGHMDGDAIAGRMARNEAHRIEWRAEAEGLQIAELVDGLQTQTEPQPPATVSAIEAAERLLGPLPEGLMALYRVSNGLPDYGLGPVESLVRVENSPEAREFLEYGLYEGSHHFYLGAEDPKEVQILPADTLTWWSLTPEPADQMLFWAPDGVAGTDLKLVDYFLESPSLHPDVLAWLREVWVAHRQMEATMAEYEAARTRREAELSQADVAELIEHLPRPTWAQQLIAEAPDWPEPATVATLQALERRLGEDLDPAHRTLLSLHDGLPLLNLLDSSQIHAFDPASGIEPEWLHRLLETGFESEAGDTRLRLTSEDLAGCWVIGGFDTTAWEGSESHIRSHLLWCPDSQGHVLDLHRQRAHTHFERYLRSQVVDRTTELR